MTFDLNRSYDMMGQLTKFFYVLGIIKPIFNFCIILLIITAVTSGIYLMNHIKPVIFISAKNNKYKLLFILNGLIFITSILLSVSACTSQCDESRYTNEIVNGNLITKTGDDFSSINDNDIDTSNNHITLTLPDNSVDLGRIDYSFDKIKIEPTTKSGKAYVRVLKYLRKHKKEIANINVHVGWDKTTAKFTTVDDPESVVCYANNKKQSTTKINNYVLHY